MKKKWGFLFLAEAAVLALAVLLAHNRFEKEKAVYCYGQETFQCLKGDLEDGFYVDGGMDGFMDIRIGILDMELSGGSYRLDVEYRSSGVSYLSVDYAHGRNDHDLSGDIWLSDRQDKRSVDIMVDGKEGAVSLSGRLDDDCAGGDYLLLLNVTVSSTFAWYRLCIFRLFLLMFFADAGICLYQRMGKNHFLPEKRENAFGVCVIALIASIPLMTDYLLSYLNHDLLFHLSRIEGIKDGLCGGGVYR